MKLRAGLYLGAAVIAVAACLGAPSASVQAQQSTAAAVTVGASDLGGVVTQRERAGSRRLGDRRDNRSARPSSPRWSSPMTRAATCCPSCRRPTTTSGCAATGWSIRPRCRRKPGTDSQPDRSRRAECGGGGGVLSGDLLVLDAARARTRANSPAPARSGNGIPTNDPQPGDVARRHQDQRLRRAAISSATRRPARSRRNSASSIPPTRPGCGASSPGRRARPWPATSAGSTPRRVLKGFADWTDRIAAGELPFAKPQRPQGIERNVVVSVWDWGTPTMYLHDEISTDRRNPTHQRQRPAVRHAGMEHGSRAGARSGQEHRDRHQDPVARSRRLRRRSTDPMFAGVGLLGRRADLGQPDQPAQSDVRRQGPGVVHRAHPRAEHARPSARRDPTIPRQSSIRSSGPDAQLVDVRPEDQEVHAGRHLLQHAPPAIRCARTGCGRRAASAATATATSSAGSTSTSSTRPATSRPRRAGRRSILDTNGNGKRDEGYAAAQPAGRSDQGQARGRGLLRHRAEPGRRQRSGARRWASRAWSSGSIPAQPAGDCARGNLRGAAARLLAARHGHRQQRRRVGAARERPHGAASTARKCKGPLNGPTATGKHCPEGWTLYPLPGPQIRPA